jgi:hypothetical protein
VDTTLARRVVTALGLAAEPASFPPARDPPQAEFAWADPPSRALFRGPRPTRATWATLVHGITLATTMQRVDLACDIATSHSGCFTSSLAAIKIAPGS